MKHFALKSCRNVSKYFIAVFLISFVAFTIYKTQTGKKIVLWGTRGLLLTALGPSRFRELYNGRCLVENKYVKYEFDMAVCELCENIETVKRLRENETNAVDHIHLDIPVIVEDQTRTTGIRSVQNFVDQFLSIPDLALFQPCQFQSNLKTKVTQHRQLMYMISENKASSFYTIWENCAEVSLKAFRQMYYRPAMLDSSVQLTGSNWAVLCVDFHSKRFKEIEITTPIAVMIVETGDVQIRLSPHEACADVCPTLVADMKTGDTLIFGTSLYSLGLKPTCKADGTLVFGVGGYVD